MPVFRPTDREPLWRDEFSIFREDERYVNRRQFTKFLTLTSLAMFAGNVWIFIRALFYKAPAYPERVVARLDEIPVGGVKVFKYPGPQDACLLIRPAGNSYVAYSQVCTHLSCAVYYSRAHHRLECPCHEGYYSVRDGSVIQGPPARPLPRVNLKRRGEELIATGITIRREA